VLWLPEPAAGTQVCGGFDGSTSDDWTVIKLETIDGLLFTPRYGPDHRPTIWNPAEWGGTIPRSEVHSAWEELVDRFSVKRVYYDPPQWTSEGEEWARKYGDEVFAEWATYRPRPMHEALERMVTDLRTRALTHDGCPITTQHVANARKVANGRGRYGLGKPAQHQKIDAAVTSAITHEAACDARTAGWGVDTDSRMFVLG
jgi:hypothetical protein